MSSPHELETRDAEVESADTRRVDTGASVMDGDAVFAAHHAGERFGRYVLLRPLGAGGMSVVWIAYDPELDRQVALKLMHERDGDRFGPGAQRLLREAQALARLSHANVVHVYDVGLVGGQVYLAMELIDGVTLKDWLARGGHRERELLRVLVRAGRGLAAAHAAGLVHLDFKPANVIVREDLAVRVVDFGLAREPSATSERNLDDGAVVRSTTRLGERLTEDGAVLGTPGYIAPEVLTGRRADARADQFSFCVTAWEALFGLRPFEADAERSLHRNVVMGRIRPIPPDARVGRRVRRALLRGLSTDPRDRFASMDELLAAMAPSRSGRHLGVLAAGGAVAVAVALQQLPSRVDAPGDRCDGESKAIDEVWSADRIEAARRSFAGTGAAFANETWTTTARVLDHHAERWREQALDACTAMFERGEQSAEVYQLRRACLADTRDHLDRVVTLFESADAAVVEHAVHAAASMPEPDQCGDVESLREGASLPDDPFERERAERARRVAVGAHVLAEAGRVPEARAEMAVALSDARALGHGPTLARVAYWAANVEGSAGDPERAELLLSQALGLAERFALDRLRLGIEIDLAYVVGHLQRDARAGRWHIAAAEAVWRRIGADPRERLRLLVNRGILLTDSGDHVAALATLEEASTLASTDQANLPSLLVDLGGVHYESGHFERALDYYERALTLQLAQLGPLHPALATAYEDRGNAQQALGNFEAALADHRRALDILERNGVSGGIGLAMQLNNVGVVLSGMQRHDEAAQYYERGRAIVQATAPDHPVAPVLLANLAEARLAQGRAVEAMGLYRTSVAQLEHSLGASHPYTGVALTGLGLSELALVDDAEAELHLRRALEIHSHGGDPVQLAETYLGLAQLAARGHDEGQRDTARARAKQARDAFAGAGVRGLDGLRRAERLQLLLGDAAP